MDTTIENLKRESGLQQDRGDAQALLTQARELRARTLAELLGRIATATRIRLLHATRPNPLHPAG